ncbi:hypothetical protein PhaeoP18_00237 [Phaeobacter piscinae]|uniref:Uncharacterized protein n=1 Tax=Phaeobacter piscinae TaxID=1580596 RepID=A0AAN1GNF6_9RHOB|nr:hypothetical protein [Phaeobacter piscinae]ATG42203.1 hypothetical protein PhaeoP13_00237 [Phaeobacter piscinae]AUR34536.1 hypothetical protein PhaeoP18_00237 [Phaeobacter piscinae]
MTRSSSPAATPPTSALDAPPERPVFGLIEAAALGLSALWFLVVVAIFVLGGTADAPAAGWPDILLRIVAVILPVLLIWVGAIALRSAQVMRDESQRLHAAIDGMRNAYIAHAQQAASVAEPSVTRKLDEIAAATRKTETALATFHTSRRDRPMPGISTTAAAGGEVTDQGLLALGTPAEDLATPLPSTQLIRALNFPETAEDEEGFAALRLALQDRKAAQVIQAAQDVLTLLSQDGIYMDDLRPDMARPEIWRQFAQGTRGRAVAALGGVRDRSSLALTSARMKQDPIFRDAAHHFLRRFDQMLAEFEEEASDTDISSLGETRTARAFMLLGRVAGTFD